MPIPASETYYNDIVVLVSGSRKYLHPAFGRNLIRLFQQIPKPVPLSRYWISCNSSSNCPLSVTWRDSSHSDWPVENVSEPSADRRDSTQFPSERRTGCPMSSGRRLESIAIRVDPETGGSKSAQGSRKPLMLWGNIVGTLRVSLRPLPWCAPIFIRKQSFRVQS
jgi:hypothetical protein